MRWLLSVLQGLATVVFLATVAPLLLVFLVMVLFCTDLLSILRPKKGPGLLNKSSKDAVSVVIPTWNGRSLLERNLPVVVSALAGNPAHQILVIDNNSEDGTQEYLASEFPAVQVVGMGANVGFGAASNMGFSLAKHDVVVLLNNDMRVAKDFLQPLLDGFRDPRVFSVTGQIFFEDAARRREETGLVLGRWKRGKIHLQHKVDDKVDALFPTFYSGGGSTAYDRLKFLELGGFDEVMKPFYMEDVDVSYMAWKRGWINLYAPGSIFHHEHRATIGKKFDKAYIDRVIQKNNLLFVWKNMHRWSYLLGHFCWLYADMWGTWAFRNKSARISSVAFVIALRQIWRVSRSRASARRLAETGDVEAMLRPLGGYFRDRYHRLESHSGQDLNVLFVSPYPIEPPLHGGAVFMKQAVEGLASQCRLHLLCLLESEAEFAAHKHLNRICESVELLLHKKRRRSKPASPWPQSAQIYRQDEMFWKLHRIILLKRIDVVQIEYAQLASYGGQFRQLVCCLFEHDLHYQSVLRSIRSGGTLHGLRTAYEYLRALRFELKTLVQFDAIHVCSDEQKATLRSYLGERPPVFANMRASINVASYEFRQEGREPDTILFVGNFRHTPNLQGLEFFLEQVLPKVHSRNPQARLIVAGAAAPDAMVGTWIRQGVQFLGKVDDIREVLSRYTVFVAPILTGSGIRVKILEAFAAGIPVVSTSLGAEGLGSDEQEIVKIADKPDQFAEATVQLLKNPHSARRQARRARQAVEEQWDSAVRIPALLEHYRATLEMKLLSRSASPHPLRRV